MRLSHQSLATSFRRYQTRLTVWSLLGFWGLIPASLTAHAALPDTDDHFEQHIRPVLIQHCIRCHGEQKQEGNLRLDSRDAIVQGGENGPGIIPGNSSESLLIQAIKHESLEMPPDESLPAKQIRHFESWINNGAVWPNSEATIREAAIGITEADRNWWAFRRLTRPAIPMNSNFPAHWDENPIDAFVLANLVQHQLQPAPRATREILIRRLYFDLLGVPPTQQEIQDFVEDGSDDAWESQIDRLLNDRRYGERWAQFWLDLVRYAESDGWNQDRYRTDIWKYRDYVVRSFNNDKPYPMFVREQLAGDEIPGDNPENLIAAGYLRLGIYEYNQRDARGQWDDIQNEMTDVAGDVFLGMSIACARCHDHKFDPVMQDDYFKLQAFFEPVVWRDDLPEATQKMKRLYREQFSIWKSKTAEIQKDIDKLLTPYHDKKWKSTVDKFPLEIQACFHKPESERTSWDHQMAYLVSRQFHEEAGGPLKAMTKADKVKHDALKKELAAFDEYRPNPLPTMMTVSDFSGEIFPTRMPDESRTAIEPGFLYVMTPANAGEIRFRQLPNSTGRRTALADWIGDPENPLTNRVIVNRIWQQHFGVGIVSTPSDFGSKGSLPSNPKLLDWLTTTFVDNGSRFKRLHKMILMSETWQQSAHHPEAESNQAIDSADQLVWRWKLRRLDAEQIRDAMLTCSGELRNRLGGPSVDANQPRRSLYVKRIRNTPDPLLHSFDSANGLNSVSVRDTTTTPTQSLLMINGDFVLNRAKKMVERIEGPQSTIDEFVIAAIYSAWGRRPSEVELDAAFQFLNAKTDQPIDQIKRELLVDFCHVLLNSNEFLYLD